MPVLPAVGLMRAGNVCGLLRPLSNQISFLGQRSFAALFYPFSSSFYVTGTAPKQHQTDHQAHEELLKQVQSSIKSGK
ncbi:Oidioi.mRNA.OKI2018_I69.chr2.g5217.t1.cds [Oikopleura dioica]|uniref:Oidioi.mRNA.OKI2018_I69.chr2.g5217.t1.cds n=1 Tax=Oikopleura dioica TaxID=34765 RepID=A0ABN7T1C8_OIKDI|nr:Oidioi.mRNA.OKI2018_I69.chr2.g5217.t1.cds [Oikopleura dioica]